MHLKLFVVLALCLGLSQSAAIKKNAREKRTLGLLSAGVGAVGAGLGAAGSAAATAFGVAASAKPLIVLGLGKYALLNLLSRPGSQMGITLGYNSPNFNNQPLALGGYQSNSYPVGGFQDNSYPVGSFQDNSYPVSSFQGNSFPVSSFQDNSFPVSSFQGNNFPISTYSEPAPVFVEQFNEVPANNYNNEW
eukprot:maker-scaffold11_size778918-snap-gene-5.19 protein:Tk03670 transcript:maker-scaffold11_size778918-snap-gene-5.19-mRNA-1 annotation:"hypothetical protein L916_14583"